MKRLGIDCDGVIFDFSGRFVRIANELFATSYTALDQHDWNFKPWFTDAQIDLVWNVIKDIENFWQTLDLLPGVQGLKSLPKDIEPVFITSRVPAKGGSVHDQTCAAICSNFYIPYPMVITVTNPSKKIPIVKALELDNFIDDKTSTILQMHNAGLRSYAKLAPYNSAEPFPEGVVPVETLNAYLEVELGRKD